MISLLFSSFKAKVYAFFTLVLIGLSAFAKWQYASNKEKSKKIKDLKREAKIAKKISKMEAKQSEYYGYQDAINIANKDLEDNTQKADELRGKIDEKCNNCDFIVADI